MGDGMSDQHIDKAEPEPESVHPAGRRARRQAEIRARLIDAGRDVFTRQGLEEATIAQITAAADVGFGTFYLYFPTKEALYRAVVSTGFRDLGGQLEAVVPADSTPWRAALRAGVETLFRFAMEHRDLFLLMFAGRELGGGQGGGGGGRGPIVLWATAVVQAAARAECADSDPPAEEILELLTVSTIAALRRSTNWWMRNFETGDESLPVESVSATIAQFIAGGLAGALRPDAAVEDAKTV
jgi:AcrR family transcriptional regulator